VPVTVAYVSLRPAGDGFAVRICTAGTPAGVVRRAGGTEERLRRAGDAIGVEPRLSLKVEDAHLHAGDTLVLYSAAVGAAHVPGRGTAADLAAEILAGAVPASGGLRGDLVVLALRVTAE